MASALAGIVAAGMLVSPAYAGTAKTVKTTKSAKSEKKEETRNGFQLDDKTGEWHMYVDGEIAKDYYGIDQNIYGWWRIEQGDVNFDSMSVEANPYGWWKLNGGKVDFDYTGLAANEYGWWYIHEGMVDFDHFGLEQNEYGWFRIESGKVNFDFNGLAANEYGWWYLQGGRVDFDYTGLASNENGTWYVRNGQIDFSYNGHVKIDGKQYLVSYDEELAKPDGEMEWSFLSDRFTVCKPIDTTAFFSFNSEIVKDAALRLFDDDHLQYGINIIYTDAESSELATITASLKESCDAGLVAFIRGTKELNEESWQAFLDEMDAAGYMRMEELQLEAYNNTYGE